jgi:hypothetical protein
MNSKFSSGVRLRMLNRSVNGTYVSEREVNERISTKRTVISLRTTLPNLMSVIVLQPSRSRNSLGTNRVCTSFSFLIYLHCEQSVRKTFRYIRFLALARNSSVFTGLVK